MYYQRHLFFCTNTRTDGRASCGPHHAEELQGFAKQLAKELDLSGRGGVRVNKAGCLDRCEEGPCAVMYPEGTWYTFVDRDDVEEIVREHLQHGRPVERLMLDRPSAEPTATTPAKAR